MPVNNLVGTTLLIERYNNSIQLATSLPNTASSGTKAKLGKHLIDLEKTITPLFSTKKRFQNVKPLSDYLARCSQKIEEKIRVRYHFIAWLIILIQKWLQLGPIGMLQSLQSKVDKMQAAKDADHAIQIEIWEKPPEIIPEPKPISIRESLGQDNYSSLLETSYQSLGKEGFAKAIRDIFQDGLNFQEKARLRQFLVQKFPNFSQFIIFNAEESKSTKRKSYEERNMTPDGVRIMLEHERLEKSSDLTLTCKVCNSFQEFEQEIQRFRNNPKALPETFIVRCYKYFPQATTELSMHLAPIYVFRTDEGKIKILSTDSRGGWRSSEYCLHNLAQKLGFDFFEFHLGLNKRTEIGRQVDEHNCAVFTVYDVKQLCKYQKQVEACVRLAESLAQSGRKRRKKGSPIERFVPVRILPLPFLLMTQSRKIIDGYIEQYKPQKEVSANPTQEIELFRAQIEKQMKTVEVTNKKTKLKELKQQNTLAELEGDKFEGLIWERIILESA